MAREAIEGMQEYYRSRLEAIRSIRETGENPFPHKFAVTMSLEEFLEKFKGLANGDVDEATRVSLAGAPPPLVLCD